MSDTKERINQIVDILKSIQDDDPKAVIVFLANDGQGTMMSRCGSDVSQLGLVDIFKASVTVPLVAAMRQENMPRVMPAGMAPPELLKKLTGSQ